MVRTNEDDLEAYRAELLLESEWLGRVALKLTRDAVDAEDLTQEALLAALRRPPPRREQGLRNWLLTVLLNKHRQAKRSGGSRRDREVFTARGEALPSAAETFEMSATRAELVDLVLSLPQLQREVILDRFYSDTSVAELARKQGIARTTLQSRLDKGLAELERLLDLRYGGSPGRLQALAPIALVALRPSGPVDPATAPDAGVASAARAASPQAKWLAPLAAAAALTAVVFVVLAQRSAQDRKSASQPTARLSAPAPSGSRPARSTAAAAPDRTPSALEPASEDAASAATTAGQALLPVEFARLHLRPPAASATSELRGRAIDGQGQLHPFRDGRGELEFELPPGPAQLFARLTGARGQTLSIQVPESAPADRFEDGALRIDVELPPLDCWTLEVELQPVRAFRFEEQQRLADLHARVMFSAEPAPAPSWILSELLPAANLEATPIAPGKAPNLFPVLEPRVIPFRVTRGSARFAHLVLGTTVLHSVPVSEGAERIVLDLDPELLARSFGELSLELTPDSPAELTAFEFSLRRPLREACLGLPEPQFERRPLGPKSLTLAGLVPGRYLLEARSDEFVAHAYVVIEPGATAGPHRLRPVPISETEVVITHRGEPAQSGQVYLRAAGTASAASATFLLPSDASGRTDLPRLQAPACVLAISAMNSLRSAPLALTEVPTDGRVELELESATMRQLLLEEPTPAYDYLLLHDLNHPVPPEVLYLTFGVPNARLRPGRYRLEGRLFDAPNVFTREFELGDLRPLVRLAP